MELDKELDDALPKKNSEFDNKKFIEGFRKLANKRIELAQNKDFTQKVFDLLSDSEQDKDLIKYAENLLGVSISLPKTESTETNDSSKEQTNNTDVNAFRKKLQDEIKGGLKTVEEASPERSEI